MNIERAKYLSTLVFSNAGYAMLRDEKPVADIMLTEFYTLGCELGRLGSWPRDLKHGHTLEGGL